MDRFIIKNEPIQMGTDDDNTVVISGGARNPDDLEFATM